MNEECVTEALCKERIKTSTEHFKRVDERLRIGEEKIDTVEKAVVLLTEITKQDRAAVQEHEKRLETLEHRPNMWLDKIIAGIIAAVISGGVALVFNALQ